MDDRTQSQTDVHEDVDFANGKEPYSKPIVICYGDVAEITKGGGGETEDFATGATLLY
jgi:hypothetical protein